MADKKDCWHERTRDTTQVASKERKQTREIQAQRRVRITKMVLGTEPPEED